MKIAVINASPKGKNSTSLQTVLYVQKRYPNDEYSIIHAGQGIKKYEKDFSAHKEILRQADVLLFVYPVYTFIAPYQLHRWFEVLKENKINLRGKFATQITTSKHFFDMTAHCFIKENCYDLGLHYIKGLSADMTDLLTVKGQKEAEHYWEYVLFCITQGIIESAPTMQVLQKKSPYQSQLFAVEKKPHTHVVIVTNCASDDENLANMIIDCTAILPYHTKIVNIREFEFSGGCIGCFHCATDGTCIYKDGFEQFLREEIQTADAIIYAFTIENHYTHSSFKCYDDRQFCNGHRTVTMGMPVGYLISGNYQNEYNLQTIIEGRCDVGGNFLSYVATDEKDTATQIQHLALSLAYAYEHHLTRPPTFYGVGGMKIFRDLIYITRGFMKADHTFYKKHKMYDFPQKKRGEMLKMYLIGWLLSMPSAQKMMKGKMDEYILLPYKKVINAVLEKK